MAIAFRAGFWNIGAEGQLLLGAIAAAGVGQVVGGGRPSRPLTAMIVAGALAGAAWVLVPALLRIRFGIDEVVTTLLLNPVALLLVNGLLHGPWRDPVTGFPESPRIAAVAEFLSSSSAPGCTSASCWRWPSSSSPGTSWPAPRPGCACGPSA